MRTLCDACESAAAIVFCAADEAALCRACDEKVLIFLILFRLFLIPISNNEVRKQSHASFLLNH